MGLYGATSDASEISLSVVVTRADGTVEDLGVVGYYNRNPFKRWAFAAKQRLKKLRR